MRILAIDPGYDRCGVAVLEGDPSRPGYLWSDCIRPAKGPASARLAELAGAVAEAIRRHEPSGLALETLYFSKSVSTALGVAEARGVVLAAAGNAGLPVLEVSPQQVKLAVAGSGNADKRAIARMIPKLIALPARKRLDDELDAIALGIAALAQKSAFAQIEGAHRA